MARATGLQRPNRSWVPTRRSGKTDGATTTYLIIQGAAGGSLDLQIHVSDGDSGYLEINPDGSVKQLHPPS